MNRHIKIAVYPFSEKLTNQYVVRMVEAIKIAFPNAIISGFPRIKKLFTLRHYDFAWLNWFESIPSNSKLKNICARLVILLALVMMRVKIVSTFHNKRPHESNNTWGERLIFYLTFKLSYKIIILSDDSAPILSNLFGKKILDKVVLVLHPTYDCTPKSLDSDSSDFKVLFFGQLRPYKNIEMIFELARKRPETHFTIAGSTINAQYETELRNKAAAIPNVTLNIKFLSDEEIDNLIDDNSILLLPYNIQSSLNSGVVIYALCKRINVIVPAIGTVNQLQNKPLVYSYTYSTPDEHINQLSKIIEDVQKEFTENPELFHSKANTLYREVIKSNSPDALAQYIKKVFSKKTRNEKRKFKS